MERLPWMSTTLPRHGPLVVEVGNAYFKTISDQKKLRKFGVKSGSRVYVAQILCIRYVILIVKIGIYECLKHKILKTNFSNDMRSAGLGNRILDEGLRYAKEKNASFFDFISLDGHVGKVTLIKFI